MNQPHKVDLAGDAKWDALVACRLYAIVAFIVAPVMHVCLQLKCALPVGVVIVGFAAWLVFKSVLFETRTASKRFLNVSLVLVVMASAAICVNFWAGLAITVAPDSTVGLVITLMTTLGALFYFPAMMIVAPLRGLNARAAAALARPGLAFHRRHALELGLVVWIVISVGLVTLPYRTYTQAVPGPDDAGRRVRLGFWTGDQFFDRERAGAGHYVSDEILTKLGGAGGYLIYSGIRYDEIGGAAMLRNFERCRAHGVEVNVAVASSIEGDTFINVWTFEKIQGHVEALLAFLDQNQMLGDPVTTLVYDMEPLVGRFFPHYGRDPEVIAKLPDYYRVEQLFVEFNQRIKKRYGIEVRICAETAQAFDPRDGDDDLIALYGTLSDDEAKMSYMIYRRAAYAENYVLDSARYLRKGDVMILNSWKEEGYQCRGDLACAIREARLVAGYPGKEYGVEVYALCYFLDSYGLEGLFVFIDAVTGDRSEWPALEVRNRPLRSALWDLAIIGFGVLDLYAPVFRVAFHAY